MAQRFASVLAASLLGALAAVPTAAAHPAHVVMQDGAVARGFEPPVLTVAGTTVVTFENLDALASHHPVASEASLYPGDPCFDAGELALGDAVLVDVAGCEDGNGLVHYHCGIHPNMRGVVRLA